MINDRVIEWVKSKDFSIFDTEKRRMKKIRALKDSFINNAFDVNNNNAYLNTRNNLMAGLLEANGVDRRVAADTVNVLNYQSPEVRDIRGRIQMAQLMKTKDRLDDIEEKEKMRREAKRAKMMMLHNAKVAKLRAQAAYANALIPG